MTLFDRFATELDREGSFTRRIFVGKLGKAGAALAVVIGGLAAAGPAFARTVGCCTLAYSNDCPNPDTCRACQTRYQWTCYDSATGYSWECIECYANGCAGCSAAKRLGIAPAHSSALRRV